MALMRESFDAAQTWPPPQDCPSAATFVRSSLSKYGLPWRAFSLLTQSRPASTISPPRICSGGSPAAPGSDSGRSLANGHVVAADGDDEIAARGDLAEERGELDRRVAAAAVGPEHHRQPARPAAGRVVEGVRRQRRDPRPASPANGPLPAYGRLAPLPRTGRREPARSLISRGIRMLTRPLCRSTVTRAPSGTVQDRRWRLLRHRN